MQRPFASGSRQAPDLFDQYLEQEGFYRKHTARDSSCLFRTISEQLFGTQLHHLLVRKECVEFMRQHKDIFQEGINVDIEEYLDEMSKPKTFGTLLELRAVAFLYERNVLLFEAFNTGKWMVREHRFIDVLRVFFTPEKHFDSVFTMEYIQIAAFCQSICYEILYKHVFKLPDVTYAVEQMLHASSFEYVDTRTEYDGPYAKKLILDDGREFEFDLPRNTSCILDNYNLCHFHNVNFLKFVETLSQETYTMDTPQCEANHRNKTIDAVLPDKYISCVRQLLNEGITPFPYKVAKALDPDIYRNIEFDVWSEMRKEQRFKNWYTGGKNFQVGVKCLVRLRSSQSELHTCHIQEMAPDKGPCLVFVENLGEKHLVPYEFLQPLPFNQDKPWPLPYRFQRHINKCNNKWPTKYRTNHKNSNKNKIEEIPNNYDIVSSLKGNILTENDIYSSKDTVYKLKQFTTIQHFQPPPFETIAMPLNVDHRNMDRNTRRNSENSKISHTSGAEQKNQDIVEKDDENDFDTQPSESYPLNYGYTDPYLSTYAFDSSIIHHGSQPTQFYCMYNAAFPPPNSAATHSIFIPPPLHNIQQPTGGIYPPCYPSLSPISSVNSSNVPAPMSLVRRNILSMANNKINFTAPKSFLPSGSDLPSDVTTLRFFYNLGWDYYRQCYGINSADSAASDNGDKKDQMHKIICDFQQNVKVEETTPTTSNVKLDTNNNATTSNHGQNSRRFHSRYFNRKDKYNYKSGNNYRYSFGDYGKTSNNKSGGNIGNNSKNTFTSSSVSADQGIQTSPAPTVAPSENNEHIQTTPTYNIPPTSVGYPSCIPIYSAEGDQQSNAFMPPTMMPVPFGIYPSQPLPPGPAPMGPQAAGYQSYVGPPPPPGVPISTGPFTPQPPIYPQTSESSPTVGQEVADNGHWWMGFPPIYFSPPNATAPAAPIPQGYWYAAPPPPITVPTTVNQYSGNSGVNIGSSNISSNSNNVTH